MRTPEQIKRAELRDQRWAATLNIIDGARLFDRPVESAIEAASLYDADYADQRIEEVTPEKLRRCAAYALALADAMEKA